MRVGSRLGYRLWAYFSAIGGVSRVDLTVTMPEPYTPSPPDGTLDENRCFLLDWPVEDEVRITGLAPRPGARDVVHHLIVAAVGEEDVPAIERRDAADDGAGFDCGGGLGEFPTAVPLGGSLLGGDYPRGIGNVPHPRPPTRPRRVAPSGSRGSRACGSRGSGRAGATCWSGCSG